MPKTKENNQQTQTKIVKVKVRKTDSLYKYFDEITFMSKNLYNKTMYDCRQLRFGLKKDPSERHENEQAVIDSLTEALNQVNQEKGKSFLLPFSDAKVGYHLYNQMDHIYRKLQPEEYTALPSQVGQATLKMVENDWLNYQKSCKSYFKNPNKFTGRPKPPGYKDKDGRCACVFTNQGARFIGADGKVSSKPTRWLRFQKKRGDKAPYKIYDFKIPPIPEDSHYIEARVIPKANHFVLAVVYEVPVPDTPAKEDVTRIMAIDVGVDNFATITTNIGTEPILLSGKTIKSKNELYNDKVAHYRGILTHGHDPKDRTYPKISKRIIATTIKRNQRIEDFIHQASRWIVNYAKSLDIEAIVIGWNDGIKTEVNMGKDNNRKFVQIPYKTLQQKLEYKAAGEGILVIAQEESYTSKASFIDRDPIPVYNPKSEEEYSFSGRRTETKKYVSKEGIVINADVNGSANILRKAFPALEITDKWEDGVRKTPIRINL